MSVARALRLVEGEATLSSSTAVDADEALYARVAKGDAQAFRQLVARHGPRQFGFARRFLGDAGDAEEVVQEVFLRVWREAPRWEQGRAKFTTWLYRVMTNLCLDRKRRPPPPTMSEIPDRADPGLLADSAMEADEEAAHLRRHMDSLPERQRMAIALCYFEEMSNREAAAVLDIHVKALESLLSRGRATLRARLLQEEEDNAEA